ncbi:dipeptidase [Collinsella provencensis]|uniref:dipeptidase n=1 Tax=Collinsella provencensis TaxID=1937461 RepID=UPI000C81F3F8|nr:membrane dipeptidase [Collinsella provencensis]
MDNQRIRIFDLHCDTLDRLALHTAFPDVEFEDFVMGTPKDRLLSLADNDAHISLDRMQAQDYAWCQCFAAFIPDELNSDQAWAVFQAVRSYLQGQIAEHADRIEQVLDARNIRSIVETGHCAAMFTVEGGSFIEGTVERVHEIADAGVKMLTLAWNGPNAIASGHDTTEGLTPFGREVIAALEERHVVIDVSHLNDRGFWDVLEASERPFAASHSNSRAICGHLRNLTDDQFRALAERGGIVGLNFCEDFITEDLPATQDDFLRHVDHLLQLGGEHVLALGSDYDGCEVPTWLDPAEKIGTLHGLLAGEFGEDIADRICFENACEFFERNETL